MLSREELAELATPVLDEHSMELVELQIQHGKKPILRFLIDSPQGVDVGHCALISRGIERKIEAMDPDARQYVLEVSSAGMNRRIWLTAHFERFVDEQVIMTLKSSAGSSSEIKGVIAAVADETITIRLAGGEMLELTADQIEKARLDIDPWRGKRADKK